MAGAGKAELLPAQGHLRRVDGPVTVTVSPKSLARTTTTGREWEGSSFRAYPTSVRSPRAPSRYPSSGVSRRLALQSQAFERIGIA